MPTRRPTELHGERPVWQWRERFVAEATVDPLTILVGLVVSMSADVDTGRHAHPGMATIAARTHMRDERAIRARLHALEDAGWLTVTHRGGSPKGGPRMAREWSLTIPEPPASHAPSNPLRDAHPVEDRPPASDAATPCVGRVRPPASDAPPPFPSPLHDPTHARDTKLDDETIAVGRSAIASIRATKTGAA